MIMAILNRITALAGAVTLACSAWAQQPPDQPYPDQYSAGQFQDASDQGSQAQVDPPSRVARMANLSGDVSFSPAGENDWSRAQRNRPMATGDKLFTDNGRAELQIGASSILVDQRSNMDFLTLNDQMTQVELTQGSLSLDIRRLGGGETYEIDTPTIAFVADRVGSYRIDVDPNGQTTTVSVRRGSGDAVGEGGNRIRVDEGQRLVFNDSQLQNYQTADLRNNDGFDTYVTERATRYEHAPARHYVSEEVVGYEDLDDNGTWEDAADYGHVWYPSGVAADWAPYRDGTWDWVEPWGWTWVDDSSWGFAPFHYGRWAYIGSRWGWVPGPVDVRPVYAPALVAFVGGGGFGVDISVGGPIGWFALGPGDVYFPSYRCGRDYFNHVNISNTVVNNTVVNNYYGSFSRGNVDYAQIHYANRMAPRAVTAVPTASFASGRPVATSAIAVNRNMLASARVLPRATVAPTAASLVANRGRATPPPATAMNRNVVAANRPAPAPAPFAQRQALLRQNPGQALTAAQMRSVATRANVRTPAATRSNVRVAGTAGAGARATANAPMNRGAPQPATAATGRNTPNSQLRSSGFARQGQGNNPPGGKVANQARNEQNNGRAQAQLRSSGYAHAQQQGRFGNTTGQQGAQAKANTPPPRESATARNRASANARFNRGTQQPTPTPRESATAQNRASENARFNRGTQQPTPTPRESATAQNRASENARFNHSTNAPVRSSTYAQQNQQNRAAAESRVPSAASRANENAQARMNERARTQINTPRPTEQRQAARVNEPQRMPQQTPRVNEAPPRAQVQNRAPERSTPPVQTREAPRAQAQYREPARPTNQREQPQQRQQAKRKDEKRDQNGGGG
jgi:hypothetical protein